MNQWWLNFNWTSAEYLLNIFYNIFNIVGIVQTIFVAFINTSTAFAFESRDAFFREKWFITLISITVTCILGESFKHGWSSLGISLAIFKIEFAIVELNLVWQSNLNFYSGNGEL